MAAQGVFLDRDAHSYMMTISGNRELCDDSDSLLGVPTPRGADIAAIPVA